MNLKYRPYWLRIVLISGIFNIIVSVVMASIFFPQILKKTTDEDLLEIAWIESDEIQSVTESTANANASPFDEINLPPLEIPSTVFEPVPPLIVPPPPIITTPENEQSKNSVTPPTDANVQNTLSQKSTIAVEKSASPQDSLKVITKVYPKDIISKLIESHAIPARPTISEKIILTVTLTTGGRVRDIKVLQGGDNGLIDLIAQTAAGSWIFEPFLDESGTPQELKTQITFTPEDF